MRVGVIVNPVSGGNNRGGERGAARVAVARGVLAGLARGARVDEYEVVMTRARGHASEIARDFVSRSFDRVIAWGGDGTVNEVAGPLLGSATVLGIAPSGSGDGFARSLGLIDPPDRALHAACLAPVRRIDVGWLGGRHFLNIGGVGFDAAVAARFNQRPKRGLPGYIASGLTLVWSYRPDDYDVDLDGRTHRGPCLLAAFANGREYGSRLTLSADADPADGWLDAVVVEGGSPLRQIWRARRLALGTRRSAEGVHRARVRAAVISGERFLCHVDGETFEASGRVEVSVQPEAIGVAGIAESRSPRAERRTPEL